MNVKIIINNVNSKILGDLSNAVIYDISKSMCYTTEEFDGHKNVKIEHHLFNKLAQSFPTGLCSNAITVLDKHNLNYELTDNRIKPEKQSPLKLHGVTPYDFQRTIINDAVEAQRFVIQVATGGGKTVIAAAILAKLNLPSIFVVHTGDLFEQAYDELSRMLKIPIGKIGGKNYDIQKINICMIQTIHSILKKPYIPFDEIEKEQYEHDEIAKQTIIKDERIKQFLQQETRCILIDECHHLRSETYVEMMKYCKKTFYKGGLSATPHYGDSRDMILQAYAGGLICNVTASYLIKHKYLVKPKIYYLTGSKNQGYLFSRQRYNTIYKKFIVKNNYRNSLIIDCVKRLIDLKKTVLITVTTKAHGRLLTDMIKEFDPKIEFIYGCVNKMIRKKYLEQIRQRQLNVIVGTSLADEGLNIPSLDALILAGAGKSPVRMIQRIGRTLRKATGKTEATIIDFKDNIRYLLGHYKKRRKIVESESEFEIIESF